MKFQIKSRWNASVLFELECDSLRLCVEAAIRSRAKLADADLAYANLAGAYLAGAYLAGAYLADANLAGANLAGAYLARANLAGADLARAKLADATLAYANLARADLAYANLAGAYLAGADLAGAYLAGAYLAGAYLADANLAGANLAGADLARAKLADAKGLDRDLLTPLRILLEQPGAIRAYKLVTAAGEGPYNGGIIYKVGEEYSVPDAGTNEASQCGEAGIYLATLDWCLRNWRKGYRILVAEFRATDIAAIPIATDGKFRVRRCKIVGEKDVMQYEWCRKESVPNSKGTGPQ